MILGAFCCAVMMPKIVFELASDAGLKSGGAPLIMNVCAFPPEEKIVRLNALKKFAWICRFRCSKRVVRFEMDRSSLIKAGMRSAEIRFGALPNSPGAGSENAAGLI